MPSINTPEEQTKKFDLSVLRRRAAESKGREYWRSLDELADTTEFKEYMQKEFPEDAGLWMEPISRRDFLKLMGAGLSFAFFTGCRKPLQHIVPYNEPPENLIPGRPLYFSSTLTHGGYGRGVIVESHEGRPTKIEGNPNHPDNLGATDIFLQAALLDLYDPDRSQSVLNGGQLSSWDHFLIVFRGMLDQQKSKKGAGLRILTGTITSPTLAAQMKQIEKNFPELRWHKFEPVGTGNVYAGARLAFGQPVETIYDLEKADIILSLESDILGPGAGNTRYARQYGTRRRVNDKSNVMNRLYAVESSPTVTGSNADHRLPVRSSEIEPFIRHVAQALGVSVEGPSSTSNAVPQRWIDGLVNDLKKHHGRSVVIAGPMQSPAVHAIAHAINQALGNVGSTVRYTEPIDANPEDSFESIKQLTDDIDRGVVDTLLILESNPVYSAPADLEFNKKLAKVGLKIHLGQYEDETSDLCDWHVPATHELESWGDARAYDGTASIIQPLIQPLYNGKTASEVLSVIVDVAPRNNYDIVRETWAKQSGLDFEKAWQKALHDGVIADSAFRPKNMSVRGNVGGVSAPGDPNAIEVLFRPEYGMWDGRHANNAWLQELPRPLSRLTWDNAAFISPATAERLNLSNEDLVEFTLKGRKVTAPAWILPGHADNSVTLPLGYGRTRVGRIGEGAGFNAYLLRTTDNVWSGSGLEAHRAGGTQKLSCTQNHQNMEGRDFVRVAPFEEFEKNPKFAQDKLEDPKPDETLYRDSHTVSDENQWAMTIDLNSCTGCGACVLGCQSENNIPYVGREQTRRGRWMHWIRVDRYYTGDLENPEMIHQPVPCMHCENAPCEPVCPVEATLHSKEGLNEMVYNRCVGTRYCSNNCPYKVRRFNFLRFVEKEESPLWMMRNPNVSTRARGVMEKCTYCVQRIQEVKIVAGREDRKIRDGEIVTACQQACPTGAITFGNILDPESAVSKAKADPRNYGLLTDLNTRPRTTYLARIRNPNPEI